MGKSVQKSEDKSVPMQEGRNGGLLRRGSLPGNKGGTGRPPDEFKRLLARMASRAATMRALRSILADQEHPHFMKALEYATKYGYSELVSGDINVTVNNQTNVTVWKIGDREVPVR